jgi:hypothetical protein
VNNNNNYNNQTKKRRKLSNNDVSKQTSINDFSFSSNNQNKLQPLTEPVVYTNSFDNQSLQSYESIDEIFSQVDNENANEQILNDMGDIEDLTQEYPWKPCRAPEIDRLIKELGPPKLKSKCFGCKRGSLNQAATSYDKWNMLIKTFNDNYIYGDWVELAKTLEEIFEKHIRMPANKYKEPHKDSIPEWDASTIFFHFYDHIFVASINLTKRLRQVTRMIDSHYENNMWEEDKAFGSIKRIKTPKNKGEIDQIKIYKELVMLEKSLLNTDPKKSKFDNPSFTINAEINAPLINPSKPMYARNMSSDIFRSRDRNFYDSQNESYTI